MNDLLTRFAKQRILIVGDVMLDEYLQGPAHRISPEAPVPVVELRERRHLPGGAANTAANVAGLESQAVLVGVTGDDEAGHHLRRSLDSHGVRLDGLLAAQDRPTTTKTRILAQNQQIVRIDHEQRGPLSLDLEERLLSAIEKRLPEVDACILSDYAKGLVSDTLARRLLERAAVLGKPVIVDPKGKDFARYRGATLIKPNLREAGLAVGWDLNTPEEIHRAGQQLLNLHRTRGILITRGVDGMTLFECCTAPAHIVAQALEVYDVTGAGDTVTATLAVALAAGASLEQAARLANRAAGIVVGKIGTTPVRLEELLSGVCGENQGPGRQGQRWHAGNEGGNLNYPVDSRPKSS